MTFTEMALRMYPYWIMGIFMIFAVWHSSHRDLLRIEPKAIGKWILFLVGLTIYRILIFKMFPNSEYLHQGKEGASIIPWQATLTVFWEDACHSLPLVILARAIGLDKWWEKGLIGTAIAVVMVSFGLGHVYQGYLAAFLLSFYIPFTFKKGQEIGFGTVMICHMIYDLVTILTIKHFLG